jgi:hypothetical protein
LGARLTTLLCKKKLMLQNSKKWKSDLIHDNIEKSGRTSKESSGSKRAILLMT